MTIVGVEMLWIEGKKNDPKDLGSFSRQSEVRKSMPENLITRSSEALDEGVALTISGVGENAYCLQIPPLAYIVTCFKE